MFETSFSMNSIQLYKLCTTAHQQCLKTSKPVDGDVLECGFLPALVCEIVSRSGRSSAQRWYAVYDRKLSQPKPAYIHTTILCLTTTAQMYMIISTASEVTKLK